VLGAVVFLGLLVAPVEPVAAALAAQLVGPAVVLAVLAGGVLRALPAVNRTPADPPDDRLTRQAPAADTEGS
jgi:hypothetical protein